MGGDWRALARAVAQDAGIDPEIFVRLVQQESGGNPRAVSPAGAIGYTQLMPATARGLGVDPYDPQANMRGGALFLRQMLDRYGDYRLALAAYNAGPGNVDKYGDVPPFEETQRYVRTILPAGGPAPTRGGPKPMQEVAQEGTRTPGYDWTARIKELEQRKADALAQLHWAETERNRAIETPDAPGGADAGAGGIPMPGGGSGSSARDRALTRTQATYASAKTAYDAADKALADAQQEAAKPAPAPPPPAHVAAPTDQPFIITLDEHGNPIAHPNKNYQGPAPKGPTLHEGPDGRVYVIDPANPTVAKPVEGIPGKEPGYLTVGRRVYKPNAQGGLDLVLENPQDPAQRAPQYESEAELQGAQAEEARANAERLRLENMGKASLAWQNHLRLIDQVQKMVGQPGGIEPAEAQKYITISQRNLEAALKGSDLATEENRAKTDQRARQTIGSNLINQRLASGAGLAESLTSSALGSNVMMPGGKSSLGYAPAALALALTDRLGGGQDVSDFAKQMLMASQDGGGGDPGWPGA